MQGKTRTPGQCDNTMPVLEVCTQSPPGQVNNFFVFPGMSFGAMCCEASHIPDGLFMEAAEAVANSLDKEDVEADSVLPSTGRIREVGHNVAVRVVLAAQKDAELQNKLKKDVGRSARTTSC